MHATRPAPRHALRRAKIRSTRTRLLVLVLPAVAVAVAALTVVAVKLASDAQRDAVYDEQRQIVSTEAARFDARARHSTAVARGVAAALESDPTPDRAEASALLRRVAERQPELLGVWVAFEPDGFDGRDAEYVGDDRYGDVGGRFTTWAYRPESALRVEPFRLSTPGDPWWNHDFYTLSLESGDDVAIEPYEDTGLVMTSYTSPIRRGGEVVGVAGVDVALSSLDRQARATKVLETGYAFVTSNTGGLVAFPPDGKLAGTTSLAKLAKKHSAPELGQLATAIAAGGSGAVDGHDPASGREAILFYAPVETGTWSFVAVAPKGEVLASVSRLRMTLIAVGLAALLLVGLAIALVAARIARPLRDIAEAATAIAEGDVEVEISTHSDDEIGRVGDAFRNVISYMRELADAADRVARGDLTVEVAPRGERDMLGNALQTMVARLNGLVGDLGGAASQLGSASQQMSSSSGETGRAVGEIARAVGGVAEGAERQLRMVEAAKASTLETAAAADEARRVSEDGVAAARKAYDAMEAVRLSSTEVSGAIRRLASTSQEIGGIVATITGIAGQTNLLALNAAIEAARAGEQGRGFAVVADEVRKLADESHQAAASIVSLIDGIQGDTHRAVEIVEHGTRRSEEGVLVVEEAQEAFTRIGTTIADVRDRVEQIVDLMNEVAAVAQQSSDSTGEVSASTEQTSASTQEIASSAQELAASAEELERLVARFRVAA